ncbi:MAG: phosphate signaling complex protein PhoU [Anaerolineales bacterium]|nr:phosphate signaling complex protein PhoU [Anaerolineales bacterium]
MTGRSHFDRQLSELRDSILMMGSRVQEELQLAMDALATLSTDKAKEVYAADRLVNKLRFEIEDRCFSLIVTQQPAARDLRTIMTAMNIIVDLERTGDQTKGIAKVVPHLLKNPTQERPTELKQMGELVGRMLNQVMLAYAHNNVDLARVIARQDDQVDALYAVIFTKVMGQMALAGNPEKVEAAYEVLRAARELERFGDLATNVAERIVYLVTGAFEEINTDRETDV